MRGKKDDDEVDEKIDTSTTKGNDKPAKLDQEGNVKTEKGPLPPPPGR